MICRFHRWQVAGRLVAMLFTTACLAPLLLTVVAPPAAADGGAGGSASGQAGGAGAMGYTGASGGNGASGGSGGGGGAAGGGSGGNGGAGGGRGGAGGATGAAGQSGADSANAGGGGGGGGGNGNGTGSATISVGSGLQGGRGGAGGTGFSNGGGGGGGGGYGAIVTGSSNSNNSGSISGGEGGAGGLGSQIGDGGSGGVGVQFTGSGVTFTNSGIITGGIGGTGGSAGAGGAGIVGAGIAVINSGTISGGLSGDGVKRADAITFTGVSNSLTLQGGTLTGNIDVQAGSSATFNQSTNQTLGNVIVGAGQVIQNGIGTLTLTGTNTYSGGTQVFFGTLALSGAGTLGSTSGFVAVAVGTLDLGGTTQTQDGGVFLNNGTIRNGKLFSGWGFNVFGGGMVSAILAGTGMLSVNGSQTVALSGANTFSGGTVVNGGLINFSAANNFGTGSIMLNGGGLQWAIGNTTDISGSLAAIGSGGGTFDTNGNNVTLGSALMGTGGITKAGTGTLTLSGINTHIGPTTVNAGILEVTGSLTSAVTINSGATVGGSGSVGNTTINGGTIAPGGPIAFTVNGTFTQNGGTYTPNVTPAGGSDKIVVNGPATINGGMVAVQAANGRYARNTQYTILTATGGVTGSKYSGVTSNLAFLTPSLSYDNNNVFLSLLSSQNAFAAGGQTGNQKSVGGALDRTNSAATADFLTVINTLSNLDTTQGLAALEAISGQPYANLGSSYVQTGAAFLDAFGSHLFGLHAGPPGTTMAQASTQVPAQAAAPAASDYCTFDCAAAVAPKPQRYGAWLSGVGGTGSVPGDSTGSARGFTYNFGGAAGGIDYRLSPELLVGFGGGWTGGTQRVSNFAGQAYLSTFSGLLYASWTPSAFYLDGAAGYANTTTNMTRVISVPGLAARFAQGQTSVNQFLGQVETGYKIALPTRAPTSVAPFARLQGSTTNQPGFTESGAGSLDLVVAGQTTNSLRTTFGADFAARLPVGYAHTVDFDLRLGWVHEYADTGRPMNASFAGAPGSTFTVFGATSQRDSASIGFLARTHIASSTELYARYDGEVGGGTDNHTVNVGVRITW